MKHSENLKQPQPPSSLEESKPKSASDKSSDIINTILPNDFADANELEKFASDDVIKALQLIEADANGTRALGIAYLFVVLKHDATKNQTKIMSALHKCGRKNREPGTFQVCEIAAEYAIDLFDRGDKAFLNPLLDVGLESDAHLSETLGFFFSDVLQKEPERFLQALDKRPAKEQRELASMAGVEDGSGMPDDTFQAVRLSLRRIAARKNNRLAKVARLCLTEIEKVNKESNFQ